MESDILTGKKINEAKNNTTDEAVDAILRNAQEQLNKEMSDTARINRMQIDKELEEKKKRDSERLIKQAEAKEREERNRQAKEKSAKEREERNRQAKEKSAKEKEEKERQEQLTREKKKKDLAAQEKIQQLEKERLLKEKAEKEKFARELNDWEKADKQKKALEEMEKNFPKKKENVEAQVSRKNRIDINVENSSSKETGNNSIDNNKEAVNKEAAVSIEPEGETYVDLDLKPPIEKKLGLTVGDVIDGILEFIWRMFKLAVLLSIVTAIVGFFLSRELLIRGRNGNLHCLEDMKATSTVLTNKNNQDIDVKGWLKTVKREKLTMESDDGYILVARKIVQKSESNKWAVILHGYNGSMEDIYDIAMHYYKEDYNILMPDLRASGESEGSFIGMGWLDRLDVINWIDVILDENPSANIAIHGVDMGADTALMLSGEPIKDNIMVIVAEGAYTSAWDVLKKEYEVRHEEWPVFPLMNMINPVAKVWGGYTLKEADATAQVSKTHVPILLIQGGQDTYVTPEMADTLNSSIASAHQLITIPSGMHEDCRYADPNTYYEETFKFVNAHVIR